jgi:hypothetical protein
VRKQAFCAFSATGLFSGCPVFAPVRVCVLGSNPRVPRRSCENPKKTAKIEIVNARRISSMLLQLAPAWLIANLGAMSLVAVGYLVEKNYVGRISLFSNGIALNINYLPSAGSIPWYLGYYLDAGLVLAILGILGYAADTEMHGWFYAISWLYCSFVAGFLILFVRF